MSSVELGKIIANNNREHLLKNYLEGNVIPQSEVPKLINDAISSHSLACLEILVKYCKSDLNLPVNTNYGRIPLLHLTIHMADAQLAEVLLDCGVSILAPDYQGINALQLCRSFLNCSTQYEEVLTILKNSYEKLAKSLFAAVEKGDLDFLKQKLNPSWQSTLEHHLNHEPDGVLRALFYKCCQSGHLDCIEHLIQCGAQCLSYREEETPIYAACRSGNASVVELLLKHFPTDSAVVSSDSNRLPLHAAVVSGSLSTVSALLLTDYSDTVRKDIFFQFNGLTGFYRFPFCIDHVDSGGWTPFLLACQLGRVEIASLLLSTRVEGYVHLDSTPLGVDVGAPSQCLTSVKSTCPVNLTVNEKRNPLHIAVKNGSIELVRLLLTFLNADINSPSGVDSLTPLELAYQSSQTDPTASDAMINVLLSYGARDHGDKLLMKALKSDRILIYQSLIKYSAYKDNSYKLSLQSVEATAGHSQPTTSVFLNWSDKNLRANLLTEDLLRVTCLHLNPHLPTSIPSSILFKAISRIDLTNNNLPDFSNQLLFTLPFLQELVLANSNLTALVDDNQSESINAPQLTNLDLSNNQLVSVPKWIFSICLPTLQHLNVGNNKLRTVPFKMWTAPSLRHINLSRNQLESLPYSCTAGRGRLSHGAVWSLSSSGRERSVSTNVDSVDLDNLSSRRSLLMEIPPGSSQLTEQYHSFYRKIFTIQNKSTQEQNTKESASSPPYLDTLDLSHNRFSALPRGLACLAPQLHTLDLSHNLLTSIEQPFHYPHSLIHLKLSHNQITDMHSLIDKQLILDEPFCWLSKFTSTVSSSSKLPSQSSPSPSSALTQSGGSPRHLCPHRHVRMFPHLKAIDLSENAISTLVLYWPAESPDDEKNTLQDAWSRQQSEFLFPTLSHLDISKNIQLRALPADLGLMVKLSTINIEGTEVQQLPHSMASLPHLKILKLSNTPVESQISGVLNDSSPETILPYIKSIANQGKIYNKLKLMIVGSQAIGKTSLLRALRKVEGYTQKQYKTWAQRQGIEDGRNGQHLSTVGVDISDLIIKRRTPGQRKRASSATVDHNVTDSYCEEVVFKTWDFAGQREYYATHQYFLTRRALYLVLWDLNDQERGIKSVNEWLINIQSRAPNAIVIIVGTHLDSLSLTKELKSSYLTEMHKEISRRFIDLMEPSSLGLPRVCAQFQVSCTKETNIRDLANCMHRVANEMTVPGTRSTKIIGVEIPSIYLELESVISDLACQIKAKGEDPVLTREQYSSLVQSQLREQFNRCFADQGELDQASSFLHEVGTILHYNDVRLRELYFLDPQWLCDLLASVITTTELNKWVKSGFMELSSLSWIFRNWSAHPDQLKELMMTLLCKFELAVLIDEDNALLPSLLPTEFEYVLKKEQVARRIRLKDDQSSKKSLALTLRNQPTRHSSKKRHSVCMEPPTPSPPTQCRFWTPLPREVLPTKSNRSLSETRDPHQIAFRGIAIDKKSYRRSPSEQPNKRIPLKSQNREGMVANPDEEIVRLYGMAYVPSGFWPRLLTKLLGDITISGISKRIYPPDSAGVSDSGDCSTSQSYWIPWRTGLELFVQDCLVLSVKEIQSEVENRVDYSHLRFKTYFESKWTDLSGFESLSLIEVYIPSFTIAQKKDNGQDSILVLKPRRQALVQLLTQVVDHIDSLLEDWYPDLGTRFHQTTEGRYLISRLIPCSHCIAYHIASTRNRYSCDSQNWSQVDVVYGAAKVVRDVQFDRRNSLDKILCSETESHYSGDGEEVASPDVICESEVLREHQCSLPEENCVIRKHSTSAPVTLRRTKAMRIKVDPEYVYCILVEEYIRVLLSEQSTFESICCLNHLGKQFPAPDLKFDDLNPILQATPCQVQIKSFIGRGSFGSVFKGVLKRGQEKLDVALKAFVPMDPGEDCKEEDILLYREETRHWKNNAIETACRAHQQVRKELMILTRLSGLPHLLQCFGVLRGWPLSLLLPLAPLGSLDTHLAAYQKTGNRVGRLIISQVIQQVSTAIQSLHSLTIIYRDLKAENLLVWSFPAPPSGGRSSSAMDSSFLTRRSSRLGDLPSSAHNTLNQSVHIALADYGISRAAVAEGYRGFAGTNGYIAPEILEFKGEQTYSDKVDIYSFGMLLYELLALRTPFEDCRSARMNLGRHVMSGGRPTITEKDINYPCSILDLMALCWDQNPKQRPSAEEINQLSKEASFDRVKSAFRIDQLSVVTCALIDRQDKCALWLGGTYSPDVGDKESTAGRLCVLRIRDGDVCSVRVIHEWGWSAHSDDAELLDEVDAAKVSDRSSPLQDFIMEPQMLAQSSDSPANMYAAMSSGDLHVYSCIDYELLSVFRIFPQFSDSCVSLVSLSDPGGLLIILECGGVKFLRPDISSTSVSDSQVVDIPMVAPVFSASQLPVKGQVWFGHKETGLSAYTVGSQKTCNFIKLSYWKHHDLTTSQVNSQEVTAFIQYDSYNEAVWTYLYPGNSLYCWCVTTREKLRTIILVEPSTDSFSLTVPLGQLSYCAMIGSRMFLGTTTGQFVVVDTKSQLSTGSSLHSNISNAKLNCNPPALLASPNAVLYLSQSHRSGEPNINFIGYVTADSEGNEFVISVGFGYRDPLEKFIKKFPNQKHLNALTKRQPFIISWFSNEWF